MKPGGVGQYFDGQVGDAGRTMIGEVNASTCAHCAAITEFSSMRNLQEHVDFCRGCMRLICLNCVGKPCDPIEAKAERAELEQRIRDRAHISAWRCY